jgi:hypothetical protein
MRIGSACSTDEMEPLIDHADGVGGAAPIFVVVLGDRSESAACEDRGSRDHKTQRMHK